MQLLNYCSIRGSRITSGQAPEFSSDDETLASFLKAYYKTAKLAYPKFYKMDMQCKLAFMACEVLLLHFDRWGYQDQEIAMLFSNSESTLATDMKYWESTAEIASPALFVYTLPNIMMGEIAIRHKIKGENTFFVCQEFDANLLVEQTELIFMNTVAKVVIVGWVDFVDDTSYVAKTFLVSREDSAANPFSIETITKIYDTDESIN